VIVTRTWTQREFQQRSFHESCVCAAFAPNICACMSTEGQDVQHVPVERMRYIINDGSADFTTQEQLHVESCNSCLHLFGQLMDSSRDEYTEQL
jgi:hypothetical protein